ncbi:MAG: S-adenosylmethionine:tRNA ribosyltransferase-isomerase, partial [Cyclobacteriaceae bacterium]
HITLPQGKNGMVHFSSQLNAREWLVEIRAVEGNRTVRWNNGQVGMKFQVPAANVALKQRYYNNGQLLDLWIAEFNTNGPASAYLKEYAQPIKYEKLDQPYPLSYYQTYFSFNPGSSEMPSAGRGFTSELVETLLANGVVIAPILLHTGVSSLEENEKPYPEYIEIDPLTASILGNAKSQNKRIIAVGTTAVRAIESAVNDQGHIEPYRGNTNLIIDSGYQIKVANGLLTGFHEPHASHLHMLQALAGMQHIEQAYRIAIEQGYYWHQFGDLHLILP